MSRMKHWLLVVVAVMLSVSPNAAHATDGIEWPASHIAQHAQAWFAMLTDNEAAARAFFTEHMAGAAMAQVGIDERLQRRAALLERTGGLTPLEVVDGDVLMSKAWGLADRGKKTPNTPTRRCGSRRAR